VEFHNGIGLGIATNRAEMKSSPLREAIFLNTAALGRTYQVVADLMQARAQAKGAEDRARMLQARQLWFDAAFEDRSKAQAVMEYQRRVIGDLEPQLAASREDRAKAQLVMENQFDQLQSLAAALEQTLTPVTWRKNGARKFCAIRIIAQTCRFIRAVLILPFRPGGKMKPQ
jgi:hypothetical protein